MSQKVATFTVNMKKQLSAKKKPEEEDDHKVEADVVVDGCDNFATRHGSHGAPHSLVHVIAGEPYRTIGEHILNPTRVITAGCEMPLPKRAGNAIAERSVGSQSVVIVGRHEQSTIPLQASIVPGI